MMLSTLWNFKMTKQTKEKTKNKGGRPRNPEPTKQVRVPVSLIPTIENMVKDYKNQTKQVQQ